MKEIPLTQGKVAIVDDEDFEMLSQWKWTAMFNGKKFYAYRKLRPSNTNIYMHRIITKAPTNMQVDHANGDGLDNRRENLRVCTGSQNLANQGAKPSNTSGYKGASWDKRRAKWIAVISINNKSINLGYFKDILDAALAYDEAARKYFDKFANTNFKVV